MAGHRTARFAAASRVGVGMMRRIMGVVGPMFDRRRACCAVIDGGSGSSSVVVRL